MKLEVGKYYRTRDGRKVGPMKRSNGSSNWPFFAGGFTYAEDGSSHVTKRVVPEDLIAEWQEGPVRTVTRKEIVPGCYGIVCVSVSGAGILGYSRDPAVLRAAAATLIEIADALEEQT